MEQAQAPLAKFKIATDRLENVGIDYIVFGGIAVWSYGRRRWTRDIDLLIRQTDAKRSLVVLAEIGFSVEELDHRWIYKAKIDHASIDLIFHARGDIVLTRELLDRSRRVAVDGHEFSIMDPENLVLVKILATKEIRPADWYDAVSILTNLKGSFDWDYFAESVGPYADKVLSFLFFVESFGQDGNGSDLVPGYVLHRLIDVYRRDHPLSERRAG